MLVDAFAIHAQHREAQAEHREWLDDIARWREQQRRVMAMLGSIKEALEKAEVALEEHVQQIRAHEEHLARHEQVFRDHDWAVDEVEDESSVAEHRQFEAVHAAARKAHERMQQLYSGVMSEAFELLKVTHPDSVVLETG